MDAVRITAAELLDALAAALPGEGPANARTVQEIIRDTGLSPGRVRIALQSMQAAGRLELHRVTRPGIDGRAARVPAYTIRPA